MLAAKAIRSVLLGLMVGVLALRVAPSSAQAEVSGSLPPAGQPGAALVAYSGGPIEQLSGDLLDHGCALQSVWVTNDGKLAGYYPAAPSFVNTGFLALYPGGEMPTGMPLVVVCVQGDAEGSEPTPTPDFTPDPDLPDHPVGYAPDMVPGPGEAPLEYRCGGAEFVITNWFLPKYLTDQTQSGHVTILYTLPSDADRYAFNILLETNAGRIFESQIRKVVSAEVLERMRAKGVLAGPLNTNLPYTILNSNAVSAEAVDYAIADGRQHRKQAQLWPIYTASEYDAGTPHQSRVEGWQRSLVADLPFMIQPRPFISGTMVVRGETWGIDTHNQNYCSRLTARSATPRRGGRRGERGIAPSRSGQGL